MRERTVAVLVVLLALSGASCGRQTKNPPVVTATVDTRDNASLVAAGEGAVWVGSESAVTRLDPATGRSAVVEIPGLSGLAVGAGAVWAGGSAGLSRIDPGTGQVTATIPLGSSARAVAADSVWVWTVVADTTLVKINPTNNRVEARVAVAPRVAGLAVGDGAAWASDPVGRELVRLDERTAAVTRVRTGVDPAGVAVGEGSVWVADTALGTVARYDPGADRVTATIEVPHRPAAVAVGEGGVWVVGQDARGVVARIDPVANRVTAEVEVGAPAVAVAAGGGSVWVVRQGPSSLVRIAATAEALARHKAVPTTEAPSVIEYRRSGGIAGFSDVLTVDLSSGRARPGVGVNGPGVFDVPPDTVAALRRAAEEARFPKLSRAYGGSSIADEIYYDVSYRGRSVRASSGAVPERLRPLIRLLESLVEERARP